VKGRKKGQRITEEARRRVRKIRKPGGEALTEKELREVPKRKKDQCGGGLQTSDTMRRRGRGGRESRPKRRKVQQIMELQGR